MEITEEILKRIDLVGAKLGLLGNQVTNAYIHAAFIEGISDTIWGFISLIVLVLTGLRIKAYLMEDEDGPIIIFLSATALVAFAFFMTCWTAAPQEIFNPKYWAVKHLLEDLKSH